uniref:Carbohydrate-binding domain-containing protein n=2 Tax=Paenibacillus athensensis TaxID=1967502 RepID=A0A4Y8Q008_9BACL
MKRRLAKMKLPVAILSMAAILSACNAAGEVPASGTEAGEAAAAGKTKTEASASASSEPAAAIEKATYKENDFATDWTSENPSRIVLSGSQAAIEGTGASVKEGVLTISAGGTYVLSGAWADGQIVVDAPEKDEVHLVLNGVEVKRSGSAPLYVKEADKVILTLQDGTTNTFADWTQGAGEAAEDEPDAAIYSKADLTVNGAGTLVVHGSYKDGLASKDDLKVTGGTLQIDAKDDGLLGKDLLAVKDGKISVVAGGDGMKSTNDTDAGKGNIAIEGGAFDIQADADGVQAAGSIRIDGGTYSVVTGGGSAKAVMKTEQNGPMGGNGGMRGPGPVNGDGGMQGPGPVDGDGGMQGPGPVDGNGGMQGSGPVDGNGGPGASGLAASKADSQAAQTTEEAETVSAKGLKAAANLTIAGGTLTIDAKDDALHSNNSLNIIGGQIQIASGDDGLHADTALTIAGGSVNITKSYEGIESALITIDDGTVNVTSNDDGLNVSTGGDKLAINGGEVTVDAEGDGLDSNASIVMTAGHVVVYGPTANNNGALDYDGTFEISGGTLIAAGSSGMAMAPSDTSAQLSVGMTYSTAQAAGTEIAVKDASGAIVASVTPTKTYQSVVISSPDLQKNGAYTLYAGGQKVVDFTLASQVTWVNESGVTTAPSGHGGMPGGGGGPGGRGGGGMRGGRSMQQGQQ